MDDLESEFNLKVVLISFKECLNEKGEILLEHYLTGWRGLVRCVEGPLPSGAPPATPLGTGTTAPQAQHLPPLSGF